MNKIVEITKICYLDDKSDEGYSFDNGIIQTSELTKRTSDFLNAKDDVLIKYIDQNGKDIWLNKDLIIYLEFLGVKKATTYKFCNIRIEMIKQIQIVGSINIESKNHFSQVVNNKKFIPIGVNKEPSRREEIINTIIINRRHIQRIVESS